MIDQDVRGKGLDRFPYRHHGCGPLMYVVETEELFIVAVAHQSKRPGYWMDRLERSPGD